MVINQSQNGSEMTFSARQTDDFLVGGQPAVILEGPPPATEDTLRVLSAEILPGRGMNIFQLKTHLPYKGPFDMLYSPPLEEGKKFFNNGPEDFMGNRSFMIGGAILIPYPNRIRGTLLSDVKSLRTTVLGKPVILPANWSSAGNTRGEKVSMHGLMLNSKMNEITLSSSDRAASVTGVLQAGDFNGRWIGQSRITTTCTLSASDFSFKVIVENTGNETLPAAVGWHPYFEFPSGDRTQARIRIPAQSYVPVNNYDDVFPTGEITSVKGTKYDFRKRNGIPLSDMFFDDTFTNLKRDASGNVTIEVIDPAANYGLRICGNSEVDAVQMYSPPDKNFAAIEPQFNLTDPFNEDIWGANANKGMAVLNPGQFVEYKVRLELFVP